MATFAKIAGFFAKIVDKFTKIDTLVFWAKEYTTKQKTRPQLICERVGNGFTAFVPYPASSQSFGSPA